ncbi:hypothetical protein EW145_g7702 [Phellinidium pouzarii]|uniref:Amino acid permease/ SLC12A domain-containing protein n=1 Tax=Phellinidium pouzarii TaxID=167371 RepID=A0A4S4KFC0_9AGAM|nr:hypothetical protein EW145_g7702 [Phellinidium pouzarii]
MVAFRDVLQRFRTRDSAPEDNASVDSDSAKHEKSLGGDAAQDSAAFAREEQTTAADPSLNPGALSFEEDAAGGMGRHLGVFSCTLLIVGRIIGTGIFSTPSSILTSVGSVGASLMLWVLGFALSFAGLFVWLELGTMFPRSGGEKVYLEAMYPRPKSLATVFFATQAILLGFTASGCIVFAQNNRLRDACPRVYTSSRHLADECSECLQGWVVLGGHTRIQNPHANFHNAFAGSSHSSSDYATATFKVINAYAGWSNINYVLNEVKDPVRTLKIAGPLGLGICAVLYLLANIAYFAAATKEQILNGGVTVASLFFREVFVLWEYVFILFSDSKSLANETITAECINNKLAKEGIPLPFGNKFWASNWPTGKSPLPGLIVHLIPSVIVILAPPPSVAYPFILDLEGYPSQIVNFLIIVGLFYLRWKKPNAIRPFKVIVDPFLRPSNGVGDTPPLPYYLYCLVGIGVLLAGIAYWAVWRIVLPRVFRYELFPTKETLSDGTVVTVFKNKKLD